MVLQIWFYRCSSTQCGSTGCGSTQCGSTQCEPETSGASLELDVSEYHSKQIYLRLDCQGPRYWAGSGGRVD